MAVGVLVGVGVLTPGSDELIFADESARTESSSFSSTYVPPNEAADGQPSNKLRKGRKMERVMGRRILVAQVIEATAMAMMGCLCIRHWSLAWS